MAGGSGDTTGAALYSQPDLPVQPGEVIGERYRVLHELGRGGMGVVVAAEHLHLPQRVAIKFLLHAVGPTVRTRFMREAETVVRLRSEHVRRVLDVGATPGGEPYMVMELLDGQDLDQILAARGPLPIAEAVDYALQTIEALAEAHGTGVVHRDLKPSNLFLTQSVDGSPVVKVLDFGIAKASEEVSGPQNLTQTGQAMGSPRYMAPEQLVSARQVDARADIWALGVTLYELLTGYPAFEGGTTAELHVAILQSQPRPLGSLRPDVPPALEVAIERCLRKDPAERWAHVAELAQALAPAAPAWAHRYVERVQRMQLTSTAGAAPAVVHTPPGQSHHQYLAGAPTAPALGHAPTLGGPGHSGTAAPHPGYPPAAHGLTTGPQVLAQSAPATQPSAGVSSSRGGLWIGLGIGGLLAAASVVAVVFAMRGDGSESAAVPTCYFERCNASVTVPLHQPVEPERYVEPAQEMARSLEPTAELLTIAVPAIRGRSFQRKAHANLTFTYRYGGEGDDSGWLFVAVSPDQMYARYLDRGGTSPPLGRPRCAFQDGLAAAREAINAADDVALSGVYSHYGAEPSWSFTGGDPISVVFVDARCRVTAKQTTP